MRHAGKPPGPHDRVLKLPDGRLLGYAEFALDFGRQLEMTPVEVFGDGGGETGLGDRPGAGTEGD